MKFMWVLNLMDFDSVPMLILISVSSFFIWWFFMELWRDYKKMSYINFLKYLFSGSYFVYGYSCCIRSIKNFFSSIFSPISKLFSFLKRKKPTKEVASSEDSVVEEKINTEEKGEIVPNEKESV